MTSPQSFLNDDKKQYSLNKEFYAQQLAKLKADKEEALQLAHMVEFKTEEELLEISRIFDEKIRKMEENNNKLFDGKEVFEGAVKKPDLGNASEESHLSDTRSADEKFLINKQEVKKSQDFSEPGFYEINLSDGKVFELPFTFGTFPTGPGGSYDLASDMPKIEIILGITEDLPFSEPDQLHPSTQRIKVFPEYFNPRDGFHNEVVIVTEDLSQDMSKSASGEKRNTHKLFLRRGDSVILGTDYNQENFPISKHNVFALYGQSYTSRKHVKITLQENGKLLVEDLHSTNGTLVIVDVKYPKHRPVFKINP